MKMEKEKMQEWNHVQMKQEMFHHHHDHLKCDRVRPGAEVVRLHNLTHCPYQSWCEVCVASKGRSDHYHREAPQPMDGDIARIQMDFMFVEGTFVDEPRAKATVLMVICKDYGNLSATKCVRKLMSTAWRW